MLAQQYAKNPKLLRSKSRLLLFNESPQLTSSPSNLQTSGSKSLIWQLAEKFGQINSVHGLNKLFGGTTGRRVRLLWSIVVLVALLMIINVCLMIGARYSRKQLQTVVDSTRFPVYQMPFPELTVCNRNHLNWSRLPQAKQLFLSKAHQREPFETYFSDIVARYDSFIYGKFELFANLSAEVLPLLNYVNFTTVVNFMSWRCDEILEDCQWQHEKFNCCEIFSARQSQLGACLAFNSLETEQGKHMQSLDSKYPWRAGQYGPGNGLIVKVLMREHLHHPDNSYDKGLTFMLGEPGVWHNFPIIVAGYTEVHVSINSNVNIYDNTTKVLPPLERGCAFEDEHDQLVYKTLANHKYMYENCKSECQQRLLLQLCNCTLDLFFPPSAYPVCKLVDMPCLAKISVIALQFQRPDEHNFVRTTVPGIKCNCLMNCYSLKYMPDVRATILRLEQRSFNDSYVEMDLYFRRSFTLAYRTAMIFTWVDLLVAFGGITGLFLGCSLVSLVELIHFFVIDMPTFLWRNQKVKAMPVHAVKGNARNTPRHDRFL